MKKQKHQQSGFTLIEILVVISIIAFLASIILTALNNARTQSRDANRLENDHQLSNAINLYFQQTGTYPLVNSGNSGYWFSENGTDVYRNAAYNNDTGFGSPGFYHWTDFLTSLNGILSSPTSFFQGPGAGYNYLYTVYTDQNNQPVTLYFEQFGRGCRVNVANNGGTPLTAFVMSPLEARAPDTNMNIQYCFSRNVEVIPVSN